MYLIWMRPMPDLSTLHPFLQACSKLICLQLFTIYPANGIDVLLKSWIENRPASLQEVLISISNVRNEDDYLSLTTVADEYVPLLQVLGLNVFLIIDSNWR
ncbi:f-box domain-containing protein [Caerostris extrusa]|uniref:F-box domain-containing protein n=1 Tax=Caerostris extrusa TaxID=172846 RepID=A0AAV4QNG7_CAEEX|nr:f-box domain-containing protein [Caerostris extrusa]